MRKRTSAGHGVWNIAAWGRTDLPAKERGESLKRLALLGLSMTLVISGCAFRPGLKTGGVAGFAPVPTVNWKPGDPTPQGYGSVMVKVDVPQSLVRQAQGLSGDGTTQVLLYVKNASGTLLTDAFGSPAAYVAPIDAATNKATFRLPPLPNSAIEPGAVAADGANAHRFEIRVYDTAGGIINPTDYYGHFGAYANYDGRNSGNSADDITELQSTALLASGETLSVVSPGLPIVVSVPYIYRHIGANIDSHAFTPVTEVTNSKNATRDSDGKVRIRATYLDSTRLDSQNGKATLTISGAATNSVDTIAVTLNSGFGGAPWTVIGQGASSTAVAADLASKFAATSAGSYYYFTSSGADLKLAARSSLAASAGSFANTSAAIRSGSLTGATADTPAVASTFTVTLTGSYIANDRYNFSVTDAASTSYAVSNISTSTGTVAAMASAIAAALNSSGTNSFPALYTASASGSVITIASNAGQESSSRNLTGGVSIGPGSPTSLAITETKTNEYLGDPNATGSAPVKQKQVYDFGSTAPNLGDVFQMTFNDSTNATYSFSVTAASDSLTPFISGITAAAAGDSRFTSAFTIASGTSSVTFEAKYIPTIYTLNDGSLPSSSFLLGNSGATQVQGGQAFVSGSFASGEFDMDLTSGDSYEFANNDFNVAITRNGSAFGSFSLTNPVATASSVAQVVQNLRDALNADTAFDNDFVASVGAASDQLKIRTATTGSQTAGFDPKNPGTLTATITRSGLPYAFTPAASTSLAFAPGSSTALHRLRAIARFKSDTVFGSSLPTLTVSDGHRGTHAAGVSSLGAFVSSVVGEGGAAVSTTANDLAFLQAGSNLIQVLDLAADGTTAGPWNFTLNLNGATLTENLEFQLLDIDTAPSADSTGITVNTQ